MSSTGSSHHCTQVQKIMRHIVDAINYSVLDHSKCNFLLLIATVYEYSLHLIFIQTTQTIKAFHSSILLKRLTILDSSLTYCFRSSCLLTLPFFFQSLLLPGFICQSRNSQLPLPFVFQLYPLFKIHSKSLEKDFGIR